MTLTEKQQKIYDLVIDSIPLTTKNLKNYGISGRSVTQLIQLGIISRVSRGNYELLSIDNLYVYGKYLNDQKKEFNRGKKCFSICFERDKKQLGACFYMFVGCIKNENYEKAFELISYLHPSDNQCYQADINYYLYLLSHITNIPEKYRQYVKSLKPDDIMIPQNDGRYKEIKLQNKDRILAYDQKFLLPAGNSRKRITSRGGETVHEYGIRHLLNRAANEKIKRNERIICYIKDKEYTRIIEEFSEKEKQCSLTGQDRYILMITRDLIKIKDVKNIPNLTKKRFNNREQEILNILNKNYPSQLANRRKYLEEKYKEQDKDVIYLLLKDIYQLINRLDELSAKIETQPGSTETQNQLLPEDTRVLLEKNPKEFKVPKTSEECLQEHTKEIPEVPEIQDEKQTKPNISSPSEDYALTYAELEAVLYEIMNTAINPHVEYAKLKEFLNKTGLKKYEKYILCLIKISILEKDSSYVKPCGVLALLVNGNRNIEPIYYINMYGKLDKKSTLALSYRETIQAIIELSDDETKNKLTEMLNKIENIDRSNNSSDTYAFKNNQNNTEEITDTEPDIDNMYDIPFNEIAIMASFMNGNVELACKQNNMSFEDTLITMLLFARENYMAMKYETGNRFLTYVENAKNKTTRVETLMNEVRANMMKYCHVKTGEKRRILIQNARDTLPDESAY